MEDEQWVLLEDALPRGALQLGVLVVDYTNPAYHYYCPEHLVSKQKHLVQRYEDYDVTLVPSTTRWRTFKTESKGNDSSDTVCLKAHDYSISRLQDPLTWFETLFASVDARDWLLKHFKTHHDIYLVSGLQMLRDGDLTEAELGDPSSSTRLQLSDSLSRLKRRNSPPYKEHEELIFAVSYMKISLQVLERTQMPSQPREPNRLRPWSRLLRKEPPYGRKSWRPPIHEFVIQSAGFQEAMQFKSSRTPPETEGVSIDTDDSVLAALSVLFGPSADGRLLGIEVWTNLLIGSSDLGPLYKKAIKTVPKILFEQRFFQLLKKFAVDLETFTLSKSGEVLAQFVERYAHRTAWLVTRHIYAEELHDPHDPLFSTVNLELPPFLHQYFARVEAQDNLFTLGEGPEKRDDVIDSPDHDMKRSVLLLSRHHSVAKSLLFDGPAFQEFRHDLTRFVEMRTSPWYIIDILASTILFDLGFESILNSLYTLETISLITLSGKLETHIAKPLNRSLTRFIYYLRVKFRPRVKPGHQRIEWVCDCGTLLYDDFEVAEDESIDDIREYLNSSGPASGGSSSPPSRSAPALPHQVLVNPAGSVIREARGRRSAPRQYSPASTQRLGRSPSPVGEKFKKYFELCVNSGKWKITLGEIDITDVSTDRDFFGKVAEKYDSVRGFGAKALYLLEPVDIHFVRFTLQDCHLVNIDEEPDSWPTSEAIAKGSWEYHPSRRMSARTFLHHMRESDLHRRKLWFPTLPTKLKRRMKEEEAELPIGWGVHVIEGLNKPLVSWLFWLLTLIVFVVSVFWSVWKQQGVGVGPLCLSVLALALSFLTSKFYEQRDT